MPLKHSNAKVISNRSSIQGKWTPDLWYKGPQHEMQWKPKPEFKDFEQPVENKPHYSDKYRYNATVNLQRKKPKIL